MAHRYKHLRAKAVELRTRHGMTLTQICEHLALPKTTVYHWIRHIPIPRTERQTRAQRRGTAIMAAKYRSLREAAYAHGLAEAPTLLAERHFRDFVVLYMAEGSKRNRNRVNFVNSDARMVKLAHDMLLRFTERQPYYTLQYHADHDVDMLRAHWGAMLGIDPARIRPTRESNSNQLAGRKFNSVYGLLAFQIGDTYLRARLQAWMDTVAAEW